ncbi:hypothetical protein GJ744_002134 [Endocarpon pusillum]|uniref:Uncharacterized protein n=1 Tax=Endocarpon pusillum TaxID=364733 RepID=A0A8H7ABL8_9EURO|nr:hypothetical protein GJ744_002134 [Endocarpon pusillum]
MVLEDILSPGDGFANDEVAPPDGNEPNAALAPGMMKFTADNIRIVADATATVVSEELHLKYRVNKGPLRHYRIPFDRMPVQGITRRAAFGNRSTTYLTSRTMIELMSFMEALNGRPLTQTEAEGIALSICRKRVYEAAATYGGIVAGCAWAFYKRKTFKFPLRKPKPVERYDVFPLQRAAFLTGRYARMAWHTTRTMAYTGVSWLVLLPLFGYMGNRAQVIHMQRDERTAALSKEFRSSLQRAQRDRQEDRKRKTEQSVGGSAISQGADQSSSPSDQPDSQYSGYGEYYGGSKGGYVQDDNSPTSPSSQDSQYPYSATSPSTGILSDAQIQSRTRSQRSSPSSSDPSNRNTFSLEKVDRQPRTFDSEYNPPNASSSSSSSSPFFDDDASPTAGNDPFPDSPPPHPHPRQRMGTHPPIRNIQLQSILPTRFIPPRPKRPLLVTNRNPNHKQTRHNPAAHAPIPSPVRQRPPTPTKERQGRIRDQRGQL